MPTLAVNGTSLAYDDVGPRGGQPLVFSHSLFFNRRMFDGLAEHFADRYRVVTYDHRGQGESGTAPLEQLSMDTLAADAVELIRALDLGPVHILGSSMGGFVALRLAAHHPRLLRSAVVMGSSAEEEHALADFAPLAEHIQRHGTSDIIDTLMHIMFGGTTLAAKEHSARDQWRRHMLELPRSVGDAAHQVIRRERIVEALRSVKVPVLAIAGAEDHAYPPPISSKNISEATGGRCVIVEGAGHSVALEAIADVAQHLEKHFSAVDFDQQTASRVG